MMRVCTLALLVIFTWSASASAEETPGKKTKLVFCVPGLPGTTVSAQPYVDKMLRRLEIKLGMEPHSMGGRYLSTAAKCINYLQKEKPEIALVAPQIFASQREKHAMQIIAKVVIEGKGNESYYVVVHKNGPNSIGELKGKTLSGAVVANGKFVTNILLDKKLKVGDVKLSVTKRALKALRDVARGKVDGAIVDRAAKDNIPQLAVAGDLKVIYTSPKVPPPVVVFMGKSKKDKANFSRVLQALCKGEEGTNLCKTLTISEIEKATLKEYKSFLKKMSSN